MNPQNELKNTPHITTWLFNPFQYIAGWQALLIGMAAIIATAYWGFVGNNHTDGVLDLHPGLSAPFWFFLAEGLINWLSLSACLLIAGLIVSKSSFRAIDILGTQALSRFPMIFSVLVLLLKANRRVTDTLMDPNTLTEMAKNPYAWLSRSPTDSAVFMFSVIFIFAMAVWMVALMYHAYAVSCNLKGAKAIVSFIVCLIIAEIISKAGIITMAKLVLLN